MNSGPRTGIKKKCPACLREFVGTIVVCQHDNTLLVPVKETLVGKLLANKYRVLEEVGRGGMSIVYKGLHERMDRVVAIKMLQSQLLSDQNSLLRFQREAQAVACIAHPNVITIHESDIHEGQPYIVMEFLTGESLADIIKRENHVNVARVVKIFSSVTDALALAHKKGVLHRDLKSSNIMLVRDEVSNVEVVKVVDFGIAKILPSSGKQAQNLTATGEIFGSPIYMSPEQCQGLPLDARSDIYSTGVMLYESLTGEPPLLGENIIDTMQMHVGSQPIPISQIRPDLYIPRGIEVIVAKALAKQPEHRFQSMEDFRDALQGCDVTGSSGGVLNSLDQPMGHQPSRTVRSTRQGMTGSRSPEAMPRPILDDPDRHLGIKDTRLEQRQSSMKHPRITEDRESSIRSPRVERPSGGRIARSEYAPKRGDSDASLASFKIDDLEKLDENKRTKRLILWSGIVILIIATILAIAAAIQLSMRH